jgi:hypothetical protein
MTPNDQREDIARSVLEEVGSGLFVRWPLKLKFKLEIVGDPPPRHDVPRLTPGRARPIARCPSIDAGTCAAYRHR